MRASMWLCLLALTWVLPAQAQTRLRPPTVEITSPEDGDTIHARAVAVSGTATGVDRVTIHIEDESYQAMVEGGEFSQEVLLVPGEVEIRVVAENTGGEAEDSVTVDANVEPAFLKVILTWEGEHSDVDLWVTDPEGVTTSFQDQQPAPGRTLDIDDIDGLGPETYAITQYIPGRYRIRVNYYRGDGREEFHLRVIIFEGTPGERRAERRGRLSDADQNGNSRRANFTLDIDLPEVRRR